MKVRKFFWILRMTNIVVLAGAALASIAQVMADNSTAINKCLGVLVVSIFLSVIFRTGTGFAEHSTTDIDDKSVSIIKLILTKVVYLAALFSIPILLIGYGFTAAESILLCSAWFLLTTIVALKVLDISLFDLVKFPEPKE